MLNRKFLTRLLNDDFRKSVLNNNDKIINSSSLRLKAYATYVVDKHAKERDDDYKDINLVDATKEFYSNFYHFDLSDDQAKQILLDSGLKESNL